MKLSHGLAAVVLTMSAAAVHAEVTGTVTATSDYDFRGITQTAQGPALQGSIDYSHESGFYAGAWGSNVDFCSKYDSGEACDADVEVDLYAGWRGGETVSYDLGAVYYSYPGASDINFPEIYAAATYKWVTGKIWYSWDFGGSSDSAQYYQLDANIPLPANFSIGLHGGYSDGTYWGGDNYFDWSAGVTYTLSHFTLNLKWVDGSDLKSLNDTFDDVNSSDARAIFSVSTTFPWTKE
jgi:uncharacterized protein (TIGR02001 family)